MLLCLVSGFVHLSLLGRLSKVVDLGQDLAIPQFLDHI